MNSDSGYQTGVLIAIIVCYITLVSVLGGIDTLTNHGEAVNGGSDRIINTETDLLVVSVPILLFGALLFYLHTKDRIED